MYINLFEKRYLANGLATETKNSCTAVLGSIKIKDTWQYKGGMGKTNLKILAKNLQEEENMT